MNKNAIQKFAIWARNELIAQVSQRAYQYGIDESGFGDASADTLNGRLLTAEEKSQRQELIKQIKEKGYQQARQKAAQAGTAKDKQTKRSSSLARGRGEKRGRTAPGTARRDEIN